MFLCCSNTHTHTNLNEGNTCWATDCLQCERKLLLSRWLPCWNYGNSRKGCRAVQVFLFLLAEQQTKSIIQNRSEQRPSTKWAELGWLSTFATFGSTHERNFLFANAKIVFNDRIIFSDRSLHIWIQLIKEPESGSVILCFDANGNGNGIVFRNNERTYGALVFVPLAFLRLKSWECAQCSLTLHKSVRLWNIEKANLC